MNRTPLNYLCVRDKEPLQQPLSAASDVVRALSAPSLSRSGLCSGLHGRDAWRLSSSWGGGVGGLSPLLAVAGRSFVVAVSWSSAAGDELRRSQRGGAAAVPLLSHGADYLLPHLQRCGRPGAHENDHQLLVNADDELWFCSSEITLDLPLYSIFNIQIRIVFAVVHINSSFMMTIKHDYLAHIMTCKVSFN